MKTPADKLSRDTALRRPRVFLTWFPSTALKYRAFALNRRFTAAQLISYVTLQISVLLEVQTSARASLQLLQHATVSVSCTAADARHFAHLFLELRVRFEQRVPSVLLVPVE
jgi:hypothetical protein